MKNGIRGKYDNPKERTEGGRLYTLWLASEDYRRFENMRTSLTPAEQDAVLFLSGVLSHAGVLDDTEAAPAGSGETA